jgi:hypothetical protein
MRWVGGRPRSCAGCCRCASPAYRRGIGAAPRMEWDYSGEGQDDQHARSPRGADLLHYLAGPRHEQPQAADQVGLGRVVDVQEAVVVALEDEARSPARARIRWMMGPLLGSRSTATSPIATSAAWLHDGQVALVHAGLSAGPSHHHPSVPPPTWGGASSPTSVSTDAVGRGLKTKVAGRPFAFVISLRGIGALPTLGGAPVAGGVAAGRVRSLGR